MGTLTSTNPATGRVTGETTTDDAETVHAAVQAAKNAQPDWQATPIPERLAILDTFQQDLLEDRDKLAEMITQETGKPRPESVLADLLPVLEMVRFLKRHGQDVMQGERFRLENPLVWDRSSTIRREPLGVIGLIAPWNYPLGIPGSQALTALFAGNGIVLKPSELTPLIGETLIDRLHQAGIPDDLAHVVQGAADTGQALVASDIDKLLFTGSVQTGRTIEQQAAQHHTPVTLELGGKDPMLVLDDANVPLAAKGALWAKFTNCGQTCAAVERVYVDATLADAFTNRVVEAAANLTVGPGNDPATDMGPLIRPEAVERVKAHVEDALEKGAHLATGGEALPELGDCFFEPTVLTNVDRSMRVMQEETFGPVLPIQTVETEEEAVELANDSPYGLTASVWTTRASRGDTIANQLQAGTVTINDHAYTYAACETPWGGVKDSGRGRTHGVWGLEEVTELKHINHARGGRKRSAWYFPYDADVDRLTDEGLELLYGSKTEGVKALPAAFRRLFR